MRVAILHNTYRQHGGEDVVFHSEAELLRSYGHEVLTYTVSNEVIAGIPPWKLARQAIWNPETYRDVHAWFEKYKPDVVHIHNWMYLLSNSAYQAAHECKIPVVQTLHNYRLICPGGQLLRNRKPCELCVGRAFPLPGIYYGCFHNSRKLTLIRVLAVQKHKRYWHDAIQIFIALTEFAKNKFVQGGLPAEKIFVKPNFVLDPGEGSHAGDYALFAGRLSEEKGIRVLLEAWQTLPEAYRLVIAGDGPLASLVQDAQQKMPNIAWLGTVPHTEVMRLMQEASILVFPSIGYEGLSMSLIEAMAVGLPIVASGHGSMSSVVENRVSGWLFTQGDAPSLREAVI
ncbi:MAG: glycosyltransferase, partial [Armatimonadota bacterium]